MVAHVGRTVGLTLVALVAFAANSILCRMALADGSIDPLRFTAIRVLSGALVLSVFLRERDSSGAPAPWSGFAALSLFVYAIAFSLAYVTLDAGIGALLLFGAVQVTMLGTGFVRGERSGPRQLAGIGVAIVGFVVQVLPGVTAPNPVGAALMVMAGIGWGAYSLHGRGVSLPRAATGRNFLLASPLALACAFLPFSGVTLTTEGVLLAVASGALTSGMGYVIWYAALRGHTAVSAGLVQLSVPVLTAAAGIALLGESLTLRFALATILTLGGISLALGAPARRT